MNIPPESVELVYGAHGKPALAPAHAAAGLRFNVSHSQDVAVVAFARGREIGIDVEAVRSIPDADDIAARFFSRRENETYRALDARSYLRFDLRLTSENEMFIIEPNANPCAARRAGVPIVSG